MSGSAAGQGSSGRRRLPDRGGEDAERAGDVEQLQSDKRALQARYGARDWFRGVAISPHETGLGLRLNVDPQGLQRDERLPRTFRGRPIEVVFTAGYEKRARPAGVDRAEDQPDDQPPPSSST